MRMADGRSPNPPGRSRGRERSNGIRWEIDKQTAVPLNSAANPLPTALYGPKIPLSTGLANQLEVTDLSRIFDVGRGHFAG
jgi:hypothetical protein